MAQHDEIANRYAQAVYELAVSDGKADAVGKNFADIAQWLADDGFGARLIQNPAIANAKKSETLLAAADAVKADKLVKNTVSVMVANGRADKFPAVALAIAGLLDEAAKRKTVKITSAKVLDQKTRTALETSLAKAFDSTIILDESVDASLISGMRVQIGSKLIDGSAATRLNAMKHAMRAG